MARDQFQRVQPGQQLPGLPSQPWNQMVDGLKAQGIGARGPADGLESAVEVLVVNGTAAPVIRCGVLRVNAPFVTPAQDLNQFIERDALRGVTPAADQPFVILREPVSAGAVAWARILGLARCRVNVLDPTHEWAVPTAGVTDYLTSQGAFGPARILDLGTSSSSSSSSSGGLNLRWAVVLLGDVKDPVRVVEEYDTGTVQPPGYIRGRERIWDPTTGTLLVGRNCLIKDVTNL